MENKLLEVKHLTVSYNKNEVINNINIIVNSGEIVGIVGASGSGKSTILKSIIGILNQSANINKGVILFKGKDILKMNKEELRKIRGEKIGMIFQDSKASFCPIRTIGSQVYEYISQHKKINKKDALNMAVDLLQKLHFQDCNRILKSYPFELSGGMNQRIGIMMAMLMKPEIILADEPTASLDTISQLKVLKQLKQLNQEYNTAILLVSHNIDVISYIADYIIIVKDGKIIESTKVSQQKLDKYDIIRKL